MPLWDSTKLFDREMELLAQCKKKYVKFNKARESIINLMRTDLGSDTTPDGDGSFFGEDVYDGVGDWAVGVMSRGFQGGLASPDTDWIDHDMSDDKLAELDPVALFLQDIKKHTTNVYKQSNFYDILPNMTKDGLSIGSPLAFIEESDVVAGTITFLPQHFKTVYIFYGPDNKPEGVITEDDRWTVKKITDKFAPSKEEQKTKLSTSINNEIKTGTHYKEHTIIRAVFKGTHPVWDGIEGFKKPAGEWISTYFEAKTQDDRKNTPLLTEQYFSRPFVVLDIDKKPWESVSRTPAYSAIHDVLAQQEMGLDQATNRKLINNPPIGSLDDHRNILDLNPQGITSVSKEDFPFLPKAINVVGSITTSREEMEFNAEKVKRWFRTDQFLKFTDLTSTLRQQPTATQIIKISAELATQVSPEIAGYTSFLADVDARIIDIEMRAGRGPFNPVRMEEIGALVLDNTVDDSVSLIPVFTGSLARAQQVKQELDPILEGTGVAKELFEVWPDLRHAIKEYGTLAKALKVIGFPLTELKSEDEYNEIIEAITAARAQAEQRQFALEAAKVGSGAVDETSLISQAQEAL